MLRIGRWKGARILPLCVALILAAVLAAAAYQRGSSAGGLGSNGCRSGTGPGGIGGDVPCSSRTQTPASPPASDPGVRARLEYEQNLKDATRLAELANAVKQELEGAGASTLSAATVKKSDEMEKLAKKLHGRLKSNGVPVPAPPSLDATAAGKARK